MVEEGRCPQCLKKGVTSHLLELDSPTGTLKNLCSNPTCRYPFSDYDALRTSSKLKTPVENVARTINSIESDGTNMDDFLNELFGCGSQDAEIPRDIPDNLDTPQRPHGMEQRSKSSIVSPNRITGFCLSEKSSNAFEADLQSINGSLRSEPRNITGNCMLPRYLADDIKRATSNSKAAAYCRSSPVPHKYTIRGAHDSCDSGISVTSVSTHASTPITYGEYVYERSSRSDIVPCSTLGNQNSKPSSSVPSLAETSTPVLRVQRMIQFHKKRFDSLLD